MKLDAIRTFVKLVESGSYAVASEETYKSPTTLHSQIKSLQAELNAALVRFDGRRLELTSAGRQFLLFAERMIHEYDALRGHLADLARPGPTRVRVSSMQGPALHLVPLIVDAYHDRHPDGVVSVESGTVGESVAALMSRHADVAFMYEVHAARHADLFEITPVFDDHLAAFVRRDLYRKPDLELLERYPVAAQPGSSGTRQYFERWARTHGVATRVRCEYTSSDALLGQVLAGGWIGVFGSYIANLSSGANLVHQLNLPNFAWSRQVVAVHLPMPESDVADFVRVCALFYEGSKVALAG